MRDPYCAGPAAAGRQLSGERQGTCHENEARR